MPSYARKSDSEHGDKPEVGADMFTRLSVAMCEHDEGVRPLVCDCPGYTSPAFEFYPVYPIPAQEETTIKVHIRNYGTMDATAAWLETAYNIFLDNGNQGMEPIGNLSLPTIPAHESLTAEVKWTPPDTEATHGCVHARVFDTYSMINHGDVCGTWSSRENPQAGNKNVRLVPLEHEDRPVIVTFKAKNWFKDRNANVRILATTVDQRNQFRDMRDRFPLPFVANATVLERIRDARGPAALASRSVSATGLRSRTMRTRAGARIPPVGANGLWPTAEVEERFIHSAYGFDLENRLQGPTHHGTEMIGHRFGSEQDARADRRSLTTLSMKPHEVRMVRLVIPPKEFPARGRRRVLRVDYQVGHGLPVQHFVYLVW